MCLLLLLGLAEGYQNMPPQNIPIWHMDYLELKAKVYILTYIYILYYLAHIFYYYYSILLYMLILYI